MPTNFAIDLLRTPRRLKWTIPAAVVAVPLYLYAASVVATISERGGQDRLNVLLIPLVRNAMKSVWLAMLSPFIGLAQPDSVTAISPESLEQHT